MKKKKNKKVLKQIAIIVLFSIIAIDAYFNPGEERQINNVIEDNKISYNISNVPEYNGEIYVEINDNIPKFTTEDIDLKEDYYSDLKNEKVRNGNDKN